MAGHPHRHRRRRALIVLAVAVALLAALCGRLFVWPPTDAPAHADAIVVLGGLGPRTQLGLALARQELAPVVAISVDSDRVGECLGFPVPSNVELKCFHPDPFTTQGEARYLGRMAAERGWHRVIVVAGGQQVVRAKLRVERCFHGQILMVGIHSPRLSLPRSLAYESAALLKALIVQRSC